MRDADFLKLLVEESPDALIATGPDGSVHYWNRGAERTFGYSSTEAVGRILQELTESPDREEDFHAPKKRIRKVAPSSVNCQKEARHE